MVGRTGFMGGSKKKKKKKRRVPGRREGKENREIAKRQYLVRTKKR